MRKWKRINNSDRKKLKSGKVRVIVSGFMDEKVKALRKHKRKIVTVVKI